MRSSVSSPRSGKPPGYSLLLYIYNEGNFFKTVRKRWTSAAQILDAKSQLCLKKTYCKWLFAFFCAIVFFLICLLLLQSSLKRLIRGIQILLYYEK